MRGFTLILMLTMGCSTRWSAPPCSNTVSHREHTPRFVFALVEYSSEHRDGDLGATIDNAIIDLLLLKPKKSLLWLSTQESILKNFLHYAPHTVFTDYIGNQEASLGRLRITLLNELRALSDVRTDVIRKGIIEMLEKTQIREID
jgi:hypothetical protein